MNGRASGMRGFFIRESRRVKDFRKGVQQQYRS
jgi:hypothetical protein